MHGELFSRHKYSFFAPQLMGGIWKFKILGARAVKAAESSREEISRNFSSYTFFVRNPMPGWVRQ
jgi:hypothetical protein